MAANNETGVIQPIAEVVRLAHAAGALVHCDAIQIVGKAPSTWRRWALDLASVSAHKLGGPQGMAALALAPKVRSGRSRPAAARKKAIAPAPRMSPASSGSAARSQAAVAELRRATAGSPVCASGSRRGWSRSILPAAMFGADAPRVANTLNVAMPGVKAETQVMALDLAGIGVSAGSACSSGKVRTSHVLTAMGVAPDLAAATIRISLGRDTTADDIDRMIAAWAALRARTARSAA
jgi:cysteine desulfurase